MVDQAKQTELLEAWGLSAIKDGYIYIALRNCGKYNCRICTAGPGQGHGPYATLKRPGQKAVHLGRCSEDGFPHPLAKLREV